MGRRNAVLGVAGMVPVCAHGLAAGIAIPVKKL
jgi:hypothetical protein